MKKYRLMTERELIDKFGSISSIDWVRPAMDAYFGAEVEWDGVSYYFGVYGWTFSKEWLVPISKESKSTKKTSQHTKLKLIENVIIKLDQNK